MKLIGTFSETRPTCGVRHLPTTFSPWLDQTWCICGKHRFEFEVWGEGLWESPRGRWIRRLRGDRDA